MHRFNIPSIPNDQWPVLLLALDGAILAFLALRLLLAKVLRSAPGPDRIDTGPRGASAGPRAQTQAVPPAVTGPSANVRLPAAVAIVPGPEAAKASSLLAPGRP